MEDVSFIKLFTQVNSSCYLLYETYKTEFILLLISWGNLNTENFRKFFKNKIEALWYSKLWVNMLKHGCHTLIFQKNIHFQFAGLLDDLLLIDLSRSDCNFEIAMADIRSIIVITLVNVWLGKPGLIWLLKISETWVSLDDCCILQALDYSVIQQGLTKIQLNYVKETKIIKWSESCKKEGKTRVKVIVKNTSIKGGLSYFLRDSKYWNFRTGRNFF